MKQKQSSRRSQQRHSTRKKFLTINEYHAEFPNSIQKKLRQMRSVIRAAAPEAAETISYNIPTFVLKKNLVHYAAFQHHIGFYPTSTPIQFFAKDLVKYVTSKGAIQFPLERPLPVALIRKIVRYRVKEVTGTSASASRNVTKKNNPRKTTSRAESKKGKR